MLWICFSSAGTGKLIQSDWMFLTEKYRKKTGLAYNIRTNPPKNWKQELKYGIYMSHPSSLTEHEIFKKQERAKVLVHSFLKAGERLSDVDLNL